MKAYEILPADMIGSAMKGGGDVKEPKPHEILPEAGIAAQGLVGWTKGASSIARGVPTPEVFSKQAIGLPYEPAGTVPKQGGATVSRTGKVYEILPAGMTGRTKESKPYEIVPGAGVMGRGLGSKRGGCGGKPGGCGCGGECGGGTGHDHHPSGMKKSGGCGPGKAGGCGCGGRCGGSDGGLFLSPDLNLLPSAGTILPRLKLPGGLPSWATYLGPVPSNPGPDDRTPPELTCEEIRKIIEDILERIRLLQTAPDPPPGSCGSCPEGMPDCVSPCERLHEPELSECVCTRLARGLDGGNGSTGISGLMCPRNTNTPERRREVEDIAARCNRRSNIEGLLEELKKYLAEQRRRGCSAPNPPPPPPPPNWCVTHWEECRRLFHCVFHSNTPECRQVHWNLPRFDLSLPPFLPPPTPHRDPAYCERGLVEFRRRSDAFDRVMLYRTFVVSIRENMNRDAPFDTSGICDYSPACAAMRGLGAALMMRIRVRLFWCNGAPQGLRRAGLA
jgi:hypothetical protein